MPPDVRVRFRRSAGTVLSATAMPYGYTAAVWASGAVLSHDRGTPGVGDAFLYLAGLVGAFAVLGATLGRRSRPAQPPSLDMMATGMLHAVSAGGAVGAVALIGLIGSWVPWPLGGFAATAVFMLLASLDLALVRGARRKEG
jgi:hypothetical protein